MKNNETTVAIFDAQDRLSIASTPYKFQKDSVSFPFNIYEHGSSALVIFRFCAEMQHFFQMTLYIETRKIEKDYVLQTHSCV